MLAKNLLTPLFDCEVVPANDYVKIVEPRAKYMFIENSCTTILYPTQDKEETIVDGLRYTYYTIDGQLYDNFMTNKMSELERMYKNRNIQLTLF